MWENQVLLMLFSSFSSFAESTSAIWRDSCTNCHGQVRKTLTYQPNLAYSFRLNSELVNLVLCHVLYCWIINIFYMGLFFPLQRGYVPGFILTYVLWKPAHPCWHISFHHENFLQRHWWKSLSVSRTGTHQSHWFIHWKVLLVIMSLASGVVFLWER